MVFKAQGEGVVLGGAGQPPSSGSRALSTLWVASLQGAWSEVQSLLHLERKGLQSPGVRGSWSPPAMADPSPLSICPVSLETL